MLSLLAAPFLLMAFIVLPAPVSRLIGAKFATGLLCFAGALVLPVLIGLTWRALAVDGGDMALLMGGTALARRFGVRPQLWGAWIRRMLLAFSAALALSFALLALFATLLTGHTADAIPFAFGLLASSLSFAALLPRRQEQTFTRSGAGSLVCASPQA